MAMPYDVQIPMPKMSTLEHTDPGLASEATIEGHTLPAPGEGSLFAASTPHARACVLEDQLPR